MMNFVALHKSGCSLNNGAIGQMALSYSFHPLNYTETFLVRQFRFVVLVDVLFVRLAHSILLSDRFFHLGGSCVSIHFAVEYRKWQVSGGYGYFTMPISCYNNANKGRMSMGWRDRLMLKILGNKLVVKILSIPIVLKVLMKLTQVFISLISVFQRKKKES